MEKLNNELLTYLCNKEAWIYEPWIHNTDQLWSNVRNILNKININNVIKKPLSDTEFQSVKDYLLTRVRTPYFTSKFLYGINGVSHVIIKLDNGRIASLKLFSRIYGNQYYQIVSNIKILTNKGYRNIDTLLLINGIPVIQIGINNYGANPRDILTHIHNVQECSKNLGLLSAVQILVGMSSRDVMYMANNSKDCYFNVAFSFHWKLKDKPFINVTNWVDFSEYFLSTLIVQDIVSNYIIVDNTPNQKSIKVMRPYQIYSTQKIIRHLRSFNFDVNQHKIGYVWHTTGSGKTISSFKTAWLAAHLYNVDKVIYLVDRVDLSNQTADKYREYDPRIKFNHKQVILNTKDTADLEDELDLEQSNIIVSSTQKLNSLIKNRKYQMPDKNVVFIVDEAHQGVGGIFTRIKYAFPHSAWVGYTGTPRFINEQGPTTGQVFGKPIDIYTIGEAISDKNVLGFHVNFKSTISNMELNYYLLNYIYSQHPRWKSEKVNNKINNLTSEDYRLIGHDIYDINNKHIHLVVKDVLSNWIKRSNNYKYNAIFTTHVSAQIGGMNSKELVIKYYREFLKQNKNLKRPLKIAVTFSKANNKTRRGHRSNEVLLWCMSCYDKMFHTHFSKEHAFNKYKNDLISRLNKTNSDKHYLDLVIVINQLLTGFDAPQLNTLYVDRVLKGAKLIQAYSRTNRIYNMQDKPFGNIVTYRWPKVSHKVMRKAFKTYNNPNSAQIHYNKPFHDIHVIASTFKDLIQSLIDVVTKIKALTKNLKSIPNDIKHQRILYSKLDNYNKLITRAKQYDEYESPDQLLRLIGLTYAQEYLLNNKIAVKLENVLARNYHMEISSLNLKMEHIKDIRVNSKYLAKLVKNPQIAKELQEKDQRIQRIREELKTLMATHAIKDVTKNDKAKQLVNQINKEYEEKKAIELSKLHIVNKIVLQRNHINHELNIISGLQKELNECLININRDQ